MESRRKKWPKTPQPNDEDSIHQQQIEAVNAAAFAMASAASANPSLSEEHKMQMANLITALARQAGANKQQQKQLATTSPSTSKKMSLSH